MQPSFLLSGPERSNKPYTSLHELTHFIHDYEQGPVYVSIYSEYIMFFLIAGVH